MGFIRGSLMFVASLVLFFSLLSANTFLTMSLSLNYENIKPELQSILSGIIKDKTNLSEELENNQAFISKYCKENTEFEYDYSGEEIKIPCAIINSGENQTIEFMKNKYSKIKEVNLSEFEKNVSDNYEFTKNYCAKQEYFDYPVQEFEIKIPCNTTNSNEIINLSINQLIDQVYYKEYECNSFLKCVRDNFPYYFVSEHARNNYKNKFYLSLFLVLIVVGFMMVFASKKASALITIGVLSIVSSLPFMKLSSFLEFFNLKYIQFFAIFFSKSYVVFIIMFAIGLVLLLLGITLKLFKIGYKISTFFGGKHSEDKKEVEEENKE